ncbi:hypothetical protein FQA39_LY19318 [Lamprigera yunnana]|nr:hypothetical protein FQA39_LY19318 [Lamprigera yunnana]
MLGGISWSGNEKMKFWTNGCFSNEDRILAKCGFNLSHNPWGADEIFRNPPSTFVKPAQNNHNRDQGKRSRNLKRATFGLVDLEKFSKIKKATIDLTAVWIFQKWFIWCELEEGGRNTDRRHVQSLGDFGCLNMAL